MNSSFLENENSPYDFEKHWNNAYRKSPITNLGWYQKEPIPSLELIDECNLSDDAQIFMAGAGASTLVNKILNKGYLNITINDISAGALTELRSDLMIPKDANLHFIVDDLTNPSALLKLKNIDLWHDRAVLHFFTTKEQQEAYFNLLKKVVKVGGYVILAQFNLEGAKKCSGLDVFNYNDEMLQIQLGADFNKLKSFNYTYTQPSGNTREYVYTLFNRTA